MEKYPLSIEFQNGQEIKWKTEAEEMVKAMLNKDRVHRLEFQTHEAVLMERRSESELQRENPIRTCVRNERHEHLITELQNLIQFKIAEKQLLRHHPREHILLNSIPAKLDPCGCHNIVNMMSAIGDHLLQPVDGYRKQADEKNQRVLEVQKTCRKLSKQNGALRMKLREIECRRISQLERLADVKPNLVFGSYSDEFANPVSLNQALEAAQDAITKFSNQWFDCLINSGTFSVECHLYAEYYFARKKHICYAVKADVNKGFFKHFDREDFARGFNLYLDPELRQAKCLEYIHHSNLGSTEDVDMDNQFQEFLRKRLLYMDKVFSRHQHAVPKSRLESFAHHMQMLEPDLKAAARRVWLLHKLAYAFDPPARILRVAGNAEYDQLFMKPVVTFADDDNFIPKVSFMIAPGFYLGKTTIKAEIYLAGNKISP